VLERTFRGIVFGGRGDTDMVLYISRKTCSGKEGVAMKVELNMFPNQTAFVNSYRK